MALDVPSLSEPLPPICNMGTGISNTALPCRLVVRVATSKYVCGEALCTMKAVEVLRSRRRYGKACSSLGYKWE